MGQAKESGLVGPRRALARITGHPDRLAIAFGLVLYAFWATEMTWPLLQAPGDMVLGGIGDQTGGIAYLREQIQEGAFPFFPGTLEDFNAPEGRSIDWGVNLSSWPWILPTWIIGVIGGPVAGYALVNWLGLVLSGVTMQVLATRLTRSTAAGIVAGFAFAFYPYAITKDATHPVFAHGWPLALLAWRQLELYESPTRRNIVLAALAGVLAVAFTSYYVLIGGVLLAMCAVLALAAAFRRGRSAALRVQARAQAVVVGATMLYLAGVAALTLGGGGGSLRSNDVSFLTTYSARLHEYFVPFGRNVVFGDDTTGWLQKHQHGSNFSETTLYLGVVVLVLALVGLAFAALRRTPGRLRWACLAALAIAIGGVVWSAPPEVAVGPLTLPSPSRFVSEVTTTWRVYSRFVVLVMLGVALMAAVGVAGLVRGRRPAIAGLIAAIALGAVATDFWWRPGALRIEEPAVYEILRERPGGIVAQYPLLPAGFGDSSDVFWQDAHDHPVLNGYGENSYEDRRASTLYSLVRPATARGLASLGVRYVVLPIDDPVYLSTAFPGLPGKGFRLVGSGAYGLVKANVYEVTARPELGYVYMRTGGGDEEGDPADPFQWLVAQDAVLAIDAPKCATPCRGKLRMQISSFARDRKVTLTLSDGETLWTGTVGLEPIDLVLPIELSGRVEVTVHTDPGPVFIPEVEPANPDQRTISLRLARLHFTR